MMWLQLALLFFVVIAQEGTVKGVPAAGEGGKLTEILELSGKEDSNSDSDQQTGMKIKKDKNPIKKKKKSVPQKDEDTEEDGPKKKNMINKKNRKQKKGPVEKPKDGKPNNGKPNTGKPKVGKPKSKKPNGRSGNKEGNGKREGKSKRKGKGNKEGNSNKKGKDGNWRKSKNERKKKKGGKRKGNGRNIGPREELICHRCKTWDTGDEGAKYDPDCGKKGYSGHIDTDTDGYIGCAIKVYKNGDVVRLFESKETNSEMGDCYEGTDYKKGGPEYQYTRCWCTGNKCNDHLCEHCPKK